MKTTRRTLLKGSAVGGLASLPSCERTIDALAAQAGEKKLDILEVGSGSEIDADFHLLNRATFGPVPGELTQLKKLGHQAWLEEQLSPESLSDSFCNLRTGWFESLSFEPGSAYEFHRHVLREEISRHALLRAIYSRRQLYEVMVEFWTDHLNIDLEKGDCIYLKPSDDREVVRKHALGNFRDLIRASATSPAMLTYLDGRDNKVRHDHKDDAPNENYARELLELHTLGVNGGYTQQDVYEAARCLTGWTVDLKQKFFADLNVFKPARGVSYFKPKWHDDGSKKVLGVTIAAGGGKDDLEQLVDIVCKHPSTARHIARKLCQRFVNESPPGSLVKRTAEEFLATDGDIKSMLRVIFNSAEFRAARGQLFKRPFRFIVSSLRTLAADTSAQKNLVDYLHRMGHGLFQHPTPDGYPDEESPWMGTLLWRWNFAFAIASGEMKDITVPQNMRRHLKEQPVATIFSHCTGRHPTTEEEAALSDITDRKELIGIILSSPAFQRC